MNERECTSTSQSAWGLEQQLSTVAAAMSIEFHMVSVLSVQELITGGCWLGFYKILLVCGANCDNAPFQVQIILAKIED